jgi:hypothetical protein
LVNAVVDQCVVFDQTMQRILMELLNQMDGFDQTVNVKVCVLLLLTSVFKLHRADEVGVRMELLNQVDVKVCLHCCCRPACFVTMLAVMHGFDQTRSMSRCVGVLMVLHVVLSVLACCVEVLTTLN